MRSSEDLARKLALLCGVSGMLALSACTTEVSQRALRQRMEAGIEAPEDIVRYKVDDAERQRLVRSAAEPQPWPLSDVDQALFAAVRQGDVALVKKSIDQGARINALDPHGSSPLLLAIAADDLEICQILLRAHARVHGGDTPRSPLTLAAGRGVVPIVQLLLGAGAQVDQADGSGLTPLWYAMQSKRLAAARLLLANGARVQGRTALGNTMLGEAARDGDLPRVALLLEFGADPDGSDSNGLTPLYWAGFYHHAEVERALMAAGAHRTKIQASSPSLRSNVSGEY